MVNYAYYNLAQQIIMQGVSDYKEVVRRKKAGKKYSHARYSELQKFFRSEWFYALSWGLCGEYVADELERVIDPMPGKISPNPRAIRKEEAMQYVYLHDVMGWTFRHIAREMHRSSYAVSTQYKRMKGEINDTKTGTAVCPSRT